MFNGEVIPSNISKSQDMRMINEMLDKVFDKILKTSGITPHSDQGWQYQHYGYRKILEKHGIIQSKSGKKTVLIMPWLKTFLES